MRSLEVTEFTRGHGVPGSSACTVGGGLVTAGGTVSTAL